MNPLYYMGWCLVRTIRETWAAHPKEIQDVAWVVGALLAGAIVGVTSPPKHT